MKKIYLIIIAVAILLAGCTMGAEKEPQSIYEEPVLLSLDTVLVPEEVQPVYALESAPIMEVEMVEEQTMAMKSIAEPDTLIEQDTSKVEEKKDEDLSRKDLKTKKDADNMQRQEQINKNLDVLEEQQMKLDSLLKKKKEEI